MTNSTSPTERVGRYQLLEPIGIGPSGSVSRAKVFGVAGFERQFAVKRFHAELTATAAMAAMLSAAARAYGSLEHPRIARMSEFGVAQGATFTAVEYVLGLDALRLISEARLAGVTLAAGGALALVSQAARAVGYAHGRGLTHLGLAPTNVIVTAEGDIKITDFGILSATLPPRPIEVPRLAQRIPYLAPEQLANEATSAATDVFALGVLAYELVTGNRTFKGETPQQIASAIMAGPPSEPLLPRPIVRVLQRCLARSPFERFPDARALADALDAALRVAPVPGTRKDIGAQVKDTLDRLAALNEGQMSGMVALHVGTGPIRRPDEPEFGPEPGPGSTMPPVYELGRPEITAGGPQTGPGSTYQDIPRTPMTMPGVPPPPVPVPQGVTGVPLPMPQSPSGSHTLLGIGKTPTLPPIKPLPRPGSATGLPAKPPAVPAAALRTTRPGTDLAVPVDLPKERDSAIHPLDPDDLVPFDAVGDLGEADTVAEAAVASRRALGESLGPAGLASSSERRSRDSEELAASAPDERDETDEPADTPPPIAVKVGPPAEPRPVQIPQKDTRPIPPETLAPLLFDPIVRSPEPGDPSADGDDDDDRARAPTIDGEREAGRAAAPERATPGSTAGSGPALGKTMLGFPAASTPRPPANTPRTPLPPVEPPGDEMAGMLLEGFHAAAPPAGPSEAGSMAASESDAPGENPRYPPDDPQHLTPYPQQTSYPQDSSYARGNPQQTPYADRDPQQSQYAQGDPRRSQYAQGDPQRSSHAQGDPQRSPYAQGNPQPSPYAQGNPQPSPYAQGNPQPSPYAQGGPQQSPYAQGDPQRSPYAEGDPQRSPYAQGDPQRSPYAEGDPQRSPYAEGDPQRSPYAESDPQRSPYAEGDPQRSPYSHGNPQQSPYAEGDPQRSPYSQGNPQQSPYSQGNPQHAPHALGDPQHAPHALGDPQHAPHALGDSQHAPHALGDPQHAPHALGDPRHAAHALGDPQHAAHALGDPRHAPHALGDPRHAPHALGDAAHAHGDPQHAPHALGDPQMTFPPAGSEPPVHPQLAIPPPPMASPPQGWVGTPALGVPATSAPGAARPQRRIPWILVGMIGAVAVAIGAWQLWDNVIAPSEPSSGSAPVAKAPSDARAIAAAPDAPAVVAAIPDAAQVAAATPDAAQTPATPDAAQVAAAPGAATADAAVAAATPDAAQVAGAPGTKPPGTAPGGTPPGSTPPGSTPPGSAPSGSTPGSAPPGSTPPGATSSPGGDTLSISSTPPGARVFLDGSDTGATPVTLPGSPDRHNIALLLAGHELYVAQVDGRGTFQIPLKEVTPTNGPAGIKVLRCKDKDRYYVFVDGKPTGQTCPTERIGCELGPHTVEVYDVVSETRRKWDIVVKDTRLSFRIRVE